MTKLRGTFPRSTVESLYVHYLLPSVRIASPWRLTKEDLITRARCSVNLLATRFWARAQRRLLNDIDAGGKRLVPDLGLGNSLVPRGVVPSFLTALL
jgi:hypothetical protein